MYICIQYLQEYLHICVYLMFGSRVTFEVSVNVTNITGFFLLSDLLKEIDYII